MSTNKLELYKEKLLSKRIEKMNNDFTFLSWCAKFSNFEQFELALNLAKIYHNKHYRSSWEPYLSHVIDVTIELLNRWIRDSDILSSALLHDIVEEWGNDIDFEKLHKLWIWDNTIEIVRLLTKEKDYDKDEYYNRIKNNEISCLVKLSDRLHNLSTMTGSFNTKRVIKYLKETKFEILPIAKHAIAHYPRHSSIVMSLKRDIERLVTTIEIFLLENWVDLDYI